MKPFGLPVQWMSPFVMFQVFSGGELVRMKNAQPEKSFPLKRSTWLAGVMASCAAAFDRAMERQNKMAADFIRGN